MQIKLTLTQRATMASSSSFLRRLVGAVKGTAEYWKNYEMTQVAHFNEATRKKKVFARRVLTTSSMENVQAYAEYLLNQYRYDDATEPDLDENGELTDDVLSDSAASSATFDYFAGVQAGDETTTVTF